MKIAQLFAPALSLLFAVSLPAATPPGKTQQLTSPDQLPEGLAKSDWHSIRAAYEAGRHAFQPVESGWQARNPGQQWTTKFDGRGFVAEPRDGAWQWGLELKSCGFSGAERAIGGVPVVKAAGTRLTYDWDAAVQEWWVNDARGLEHGFTVKERPAENPALNSQLPTLNFLLSVRGTLRPKVTADAQGVEFRDAAGATVLTYAGLKVWDADGKILRSHFTPLDPRQPALVTLAVEESGARYPLTIDPIAQQAFLKAGNTGADDRFGYSVSVSGDTVVVGADREDSSTTGVNSVPDELAANSGAAYVFVRSGTMWTQQAHLKAGNAGPGDQFGYAVAVSGDTVVVGAIAEDSRTTGVNSTPDENRANSGAAYVFVRTGTTWSQQAYLKASSTGNNVQFGWSVAISGETVVVGCYSFISTWGAYVFVRSGTTWSQQEFLQAGNPGVDLFGASVSVSGDTVIVGAPYEDSNTTGVNSTPDELSMDSGAAYVFVRSGTTWTQQAYLKASNAVKWESFFGQSVGIFGDTAIVGAPGEFSSTTGVNSTPDTLWRSPGAVYVFVRSGTTWSQQAYLKASNTGPFDAFGTSVAISDETVVVGAPFEGSSTTGVNSTPDENATSSGAAYVFVRSGTTWSQQAYLKAGNTASQDRFGMSVGMSGDTVIVGAIWEDSGTTGVNPTPDESATDSGAAYIFTGLGPSLTALQIWRQQYFGITGNSGNAADTFDFEGDGLVNFLEWACRLDPTLPSAPPATIVRNGANLEFTYTRSVSAVTAGTTFTVEWSDPLAPANWSTSGVSEMILSDNGIVQQIKALVPAGGSDQRFVHLKVTGPP